MPRLYILIVFFILLNALLAIIVSGYDSVTRDVVKGWREPLPCAWRLWWHRVVTGEFAGICLGDEALIAALQKAAGDGSEEPREATPPPELAEASEEQLAASVKKLDALREEMQGLSIEVHGMPLTEAQLIKQLERLDLSPVFARVLAFNAILRVGTPSTDAGEDAEERAEHRTRSQIAAFGLLL